MDTITKDEVLVLRHQDIDVCETIIYETRNYDLFKFYASNRPTDHYLKIAQNIEKKDLTHLNPIKVKPIDNYFWIVDGQNSFMACKHLKKKIRFVVDSNLKEEDIILLNVQQRNWTLKNYHHFYIEHGLEDYVQLAKMMNNTGLRLMWIINMISQKGKVNGMSATELFKKGKFKFTEEAKIRCKRVSDVLFIIENMVDNSKIKQLRYLVGAINTLLNAGMKKQRLISQVKKYPYLFETKGDTEGYKDLLEKFYNHRKKGENKVSFRYKS